MKHGHSLHAFVQVILMPRTLRPLAISINSEIFIAAFTIPSFDVN